MSESYVTTLSPEAKTRYEEKIQLIGGLDPYSSNLGRESDHIPPVDAADMLSYLVLQTSYLTIERFHHVIEIIADVSIAPSWCTASVQ